MLKTVSDLFSSDGLAPFRSELLWGGLVSEAAVGIGIILESWKPKSLKECVAFVLIVGGVVFSAICTLLLFSTDEGISNAQQSKIISLEAQLAPRTLSKEQYDAIQELRGIVTDIGIIPEPHCLECLSFANSLELAFHGAGAQLYRGNFGELPLGEWSGNGLMLYLPLGDISNDNPIIAALLKANLFGGAAAHQQSNSPIRTDIPVLLVGEKPFSHFPPSVIPYFPTESQTWSYLPINK